MTNEQTILKKSIVSEIEDILYENETDSEEECDDLQINIQRLSTTDSGEEYEVSSLLNKRTLHGKTQYLVNWIGMEPTWEDESDIISNSLITNFNIQTKINKHNASIPNPSKLVRIYARVSDTQKTKANIQQSSNQTGFDTNNLSLDFQIHGLINECHRLNCKISGFAIDDGISARHMKNLTGLNRLIDEIQTHEVLMVYELSRFSRNTFEGVKILNDLANCGVGFWSVSEQLDYGSPTNRHCVRTNISIGEIFSDTVSEKVKARREYLKGLGAHPGGKVGYGLKTVKVGSLTTVIPHNNEQRILRVIKSQWNKLTKHKMCVNSDGNPKYSKIYNLISTGLNENGKQYRGKQFTNRNVSYLLRNCLRNIVQPVKKGGVKKCKQRIAKVSKSSLKH